MKYFVVVSKKCSSLDITKEMCEKEDKTHEKHKTSVL